MATTDDIAPIEAQSVLPPATRPRDELDDALYGLQRAISLVKVTTAAPVEELDPAQHEQAMELVIGQLDEAYNAMDRAIVNVGRTRAATAAEAEGTHEEPQESTDSASAPDAQPSPVPLSKQLRQVSIRLGKCHSAIALIARALVASETVGEQSDTAGWAADEFERIEPDLDELAGIMTMIWFDVEHLEKKAAVAEKEKRTSPEDQAKAIGELADEVIRRRRRPTGPDKAEGYRDGESLEPEHP